MVMLLALPCLSFNLIDITLTQRATIDSVKVIVTWTHTGIRELSCKRADKSRIARTMTYMTIRPPARDPNSFAIASLLEIIRLVLTLTNIKIFSTLDGEKTSA